MKSNRKALKTPKSYSFDVDHNPYEVNSYNNTSGMGKTILFPIFHYEGERQYLDLLNPFLEKGYHVVTVKLLNKGDHVLFFDYYFSVFEKLLALIIQHRIIKNEQIVLLGFGVGAIIASYLNNTKIKGISKILLVSPVNKFKDEYSISREVQNFKIPTYFFFGQFDTVNSVETRFAIFEKGKKNKKVHFHSYPACGHYLYYKNDLSMEIESNYKKNNYDLLLGENSKYKSSYLPENVRYNERFYEHIFNIIEDVPLKKRIALLTDVFPLFINGVSTVVGLLKKELDKLGYETYIVALWDKSLSLDKLPEDYIPILASPANFVKGHNELHLLKSFAFQRSAKSLTTFGFDYLHLHTEYSMSQIALYLAKFTDIKMVYTYHTLWKLYYENKFGKMMGDITYKAAKDLLFSKVYKECPVITVPSYKSYEILKEESSSKDIRIIPSSIDANKFKLNKSDYDVIKSLKDEYNLKGKKVVGYVGRVSTEKNIVETLDYISRIKSEIPNIVFMIVGVGDAIKSLKKTIKKLKLTHNVIFVGEIENAKLKYYYSLFDVFVTASNFETQGLTFFEAATCGTLILAKEDKALEGVFEDGRNALIYKDFYGWTERIERALFRNNKKITDEAKNTMKNYASDKWAKKILSIYQELNNQKKN